MIDSNHYSCFVLDNLLAILCEETFVGRIVWLTGCGVEEIGSIHRAKRAVDRGRLWADARRPAKIAGRRVMPTYL